jgi:hypothetical protein
MIYKIDYCMTGRLQYRTSPNELLKAWGGNFANDPGFVKAISLGYFF